MQEYWGISAIILFILTVIIRSYTLKKQGIDPVEFGKKDKNDFILIPFALFYLYLIIANAFRFSPIPGQILFRNEIISWIGVIFCSTAILFFIWSIISFKKSFRVGLVENKKEGLITNGAFSVSRNPIYVSFGLMLIGQFLIFSNWILLIYIVAGTGRFHLQILKEENFLREQYGAEFQDYCKKVRRYL